MASVGVTALTFRCTACGNCCRNLRVAVTGFDVARLVRATGSAPDELVAWLAPDAVDMTGEPDSFVELDQGRRLMVLRQRDSACHLLGADDHCRAYAARPRDCVAFPFAFVPAPNNARRLTLLALDRCDYAIDGHNDVSAVDAADSARWTELHDYQALVRRWNRRAWHRRRLHKPLATASDFLAFILNEPSARESQS